MTNTNTNGKRSFGATFRMLNDITNCSHGDVGISASSGNDGNSEIAVHHIPSLPNEKEAAEILRRIHFEFKVIIKRRGWRVTSITEMCCCGDGIDCLKKRGRKTRTMPHNVLGYNRICHSRHGNVHDIHLRLRHPRTHVLLDYESIAGTMCHELAHCVRGCHDAKFYKAMEDIEEQYSVYLAKGVVLDRDGFPIGSSESHVLGSGGTNNTGINRRAQADRTKALKAAESRQKKSQIGLTQGYRLGGKFSSVQKDPREAARIAAERRFWDSQYCIPCDEIIEILGEDSSDEDANDDEVEVFDAGENLEGASGKETRKRQRAKTDTDKKGPNLKPIAKDNSATSDVIDLTLDVSFTSDMSPAVTLKPCSKSKLPNNLKSVATHLETSQFWNCPRCSLCNPPVILVCNACYLERPCSKTVSEQAKEFKREDEIAYIKAREVSQSMEMFGGFNIYGEKKNSSSTMNHLT